MKYGKRYARKFNRLLIVDFEATCYERDVWPQTEDHPQGETSEPIEFGITSLAISDKAIISIEKSDGFLVVPQRSSVSEYCTKLTGHTFQELKKHGQPYSMVCSRIINEYHPLNIPWCSWGEYDYNLWCKANAMYPETRECFSHSHFNLSYLFSMKYGINNKLSVSKALEFLGLKFIGRPHNGRDDSFNIARIAGITLWNQDPAQMGLTTNV